jgi:hypothetical protein
LSIRGGNAGGGAMHLTSTPNTLQTEMGLAGAATVQRTVGNVSPQTLICCSQYGQANRNSDPHIGLSVNQLVDGPPSGTVSLANPVGLYIQMPDFSNYALPADPKLPRNASVADCWQILRGAAVVTDKLRRLLRAGAGGAPPKAHAPQYASDYSFLFGDAQSPAPLKRAAKRKTAP